jgi:hypothetical protein
VVVRDHERRNIIACADCGRERNHEGRGLCSVCYYRHRHQGDLAQFPRTLLRSADTVEDYEFLARQGYTRALAAERMGITKKRLEKAIERQSRRLQVAS